MQMCTLFQAAAEARASAVERAKVRATAVGKTPLALSVYMGLPHSSSAIVL
jgi:hypothetical protein